MERRRDERKYMKRGIEEYEKLKGNNGRSLQQKNRRYKNEDKEEKRKRFKNMKRAGFRGKNR